MTPPFRQDDGNVRAPALSRAVCVVVQVVAVGRTVIFVLPVRVVCLPAEGLYIIWRIHVCARFAHHEATVKF